MNHTEFFDTVRKTLKPTHQSMYDLLYMKGLNDHLTNETIGTCIDIILRVYMHNRVDNIPVYMLVYDHKVIMDRSQGRSMRVRMDENRYIVKTDLWPEYTFYLDSSLGKSTELPFNELLSIVHTMALPERNDPRFILSPQHQQKIDRRGVYYNNGWYVGGHRMDISLFENIDRVPYLKPYDRINKRINTIGTGGLLYGGHDSDYIVFLGSDNYEKAPLNAGILINRDQSGYFNRTETFFLDKHAFKLFPGDDRNASQLTSVLNTVRSLIKKRIEKKLESIEDGSHLLDGFILTGIESHGLPTTLYRNLDGSTWIDTDRDIRLSEIRDNKLLESIRKAYYEFYL